MLEFSNHPFTTLIIIPFRPSTHSLHIMAPEVRYPSDDVSPEPLGKPLHFEFSGQTAPNRLYVFIYYTILISSD